MIFALLLAIVFAGFAALAWRDLKLASTVLLGLLPTYLVRFSIGPVPMTLLEGFLLIVIGVYVARDYRRSLSGFSTNTKIGALAIIAVSMLAIFVAPDHISALGIWKAYFLEPVLFGMIVMRIL